MNQVLQDTIAARDLLASGGWIPYRLRDESGSHCAVGAVLDTVMADGLFGVGRTPCGVNFIFDPRAPRVRAVLRELIQSVPGAKVDTVEMNWNRVVNYNNTMGEQVVMDMFNATIARLTKIEAKTPVVASK